MSKPVELEIDDVHLLLEPREVDASLSSDWDQAAKTRRLRAFEQQLHAQGFFALVKFDIDCTLLQRGPLLENLLENR